MGNGCSRAVFKKNELDMFSNHQTGKIGDLVFCLLHGEKRKIAGIDKGTYGGLENRSIGLWIMRSII